MTFPDTCLEWAFGRRDGNTVRCAAARDFLPARTSLPAPAGTPVRDGES